MSTTTLAAAIGQVRLLGRFFTAGNFGELTGVSDTFPPSFSLAVVDLLHAGRATGADVLDLVFVVRVAVRTVRIESTWNLHGSVLGLSLVPSHKTRLIFTWTCAGTTAPRDSGRFDGATTPTTSSSRYPVLGTTTVMSAVSLVGNGDIQAAGDTSESDGGALRSLRPAS